MVNKEKVNAVIKRSWISFFKSFLLLVGFLALVFLIIARFFPPFIKVYFIAIAGGFGLGSLLYIFNEPLVRLCMGLKQVKTRENHPQLWDLVKEIVAKKQCAFPRIYIAEESGMNAFAFGMGFPGFSAVAATTGILEKLSREEVRAVMAHEIGHIQNRDMMVSIMMTIALISISFLGWIIKEWGGYFLSSGRTDSKSSSDSGNSSWGRILIYVCAIALGEIIFHAGRGLAYLLQLYVSREREYAADAFSAEVVGNTKPLKDALNKIVADPSIGGKKTNAAFGFLCTADPNPEDFLSTHPSLDKRLAALDDLES